MAKKLFALTIAMLFIFSAIGALAAQSQQAPQPRELDKPTASVDPEKTKDRASRGMNNLLYGTLEIPRNIDETHTKGTKVENCTEKTRSGLERGIARVFTGAWQLLTFWASEPECATTSGTIKAPVKAPVGPTAVRTPAAMPEAVK